MLLELELDLGIVTRKISSNCDVFRDYTYQRHGNHSHDDAQTTYTQMISCYLNSVVSAFTKRGPPALAWGCSTPVIASRCQERSQGGPEQSANWKRLATKGSKVRERTAIGSTPPIRLPGAVYLPPLRPARRGKARRSSLRATTAAGSGAKVAEAAAARAPAGGARAWTPRPARASARALRSRMGAEVERAPARSGALGARRCGHELLLLLLRLQTDAAPAANCGCCCC